MTPAVEKYQSPKEIAAWICETHGRCLSDDYIRDVRAESIRRGEKLFVAGHARPSAVWQWLEANPGFHPWSLRKKKAA